MQTVFPPPSIRIGSHGKNNACCTPRELSGKNRSFKTRTIWSFASVKGNFLFSHIYRKEKIENPVSTGMKDGGKVIEKIKSSWETESRLYGYHEEKNGPVLVKK